MPTLLGTKIRRLRKEKGLSLDQLATLAETSKSYLWELENRETANPTMDKVAKIADKLGVTAEFLLNDDAAEPSESDADQVFFRKYKKLRIFPTLSYHGQTSVGQIDLVILFINVKI